jgi:hypothetical protein
MTMKMRMRTTMMAAGLAAAMLTGTTKADDRNFGRRKIDTKVDVKASVESTRYAALLHVNAEVEIEQTRNTRFDRFQLLLTVEPAHVPHYSRSYVGPQTFVIPLDRPTDIDDDEIEFKERFTVQLPHHLLRAGQLVIRADLMRLDDGRIIERDTQLVTRHFDRRPPAPRRRGHGRRRIW